MAEQPRITPEKSKFFLLFDKREDPMRRIFFLVFVCIISSTASYADDFLKNDLLVQLYHLQDASIREVKEGKYYLNSERICLSDNRIFLHSDFFGPLMLSHVSQDIEGMYVGLYYYYSCDDCGVSYQSRPSECDVCGGTSFTRHDQLPGEE
jgi:hypothetical protein